MVLLITTPRGLVSGSQYLGSRYNPSIFRLYGVIYVKIKILISTAVKISNLFSKIIWESSSNPSATKFTKTTLNSTDRTLVHVIDLGNGFCSQQSEQKVNPIYHRSHSGGVRGGEQACARKTRRRNTTYTEEELFSFP